MKIASLTEIKKTLHHVSEKELIAIISDLAKFSVDNKRYLYFQLYGREQPDLFESMVKEALLEEFDKANTNYAHVAKKSAQKIRRLLNKYLKYSKDKAIKAELIAFFCEQMIEYEYLSFHHPVIHNLYAVQIGKMEKLVQGLHEDLQFDFETKIADLKENC